MVSAELIDADIGTQIETVEAQRFAVEQLTLKTPANRKTLVRALSFEVGAGEGLLIVGESGAGKTSILRAVSGLWRTGSGTIIRPPLSAVMFLPQRPYMILGSLHDQLCYPHASQVTDEELLAILKMVNLKDLPERLGGFDAEVKWDDLLSLGEQQQIAFARVLFNHPEYGTVFEWYGRCLRSPWKRCEITQVQKRPFSALVGNRFRIATERRCEHADESCRF